MILLYYKNKSSSNNTRIIDQIPSNTLASCDLVIGKKKQKLRFDVEKSRYTREKSDLSLSETIKFLVYYGVRHLSYKFKN